MPSSPHTPTRRRRLSDCAQTLSPPRINQCSPADKRSSQGFSNHSVASPVSLKSPSTLDSPGFDASNHSLDYKDASDGLGNLAEELAEAWDHECGGDIQLASVVEKKESDLSGRCHEHQRPASIIGRGMAINISNVSDDGSNHCQSLSPPKQRAQSGLYRTTSQTSLYDGSDCGDSSNLEDVHGIPLSLENRLAAIESLARCGAESNGSGADTIAMRVAESLRDLPSQAVVEAGASRLTTAYTAISTNLMHQTRIIQTLSAQLMSPFTFPPSFDEVEDMLPLLVATLELIPRSNPRAALAINSLHVSALDLISSLSVLADSLHMIRQTTSSASRRLKAAKDAIKELKIEAELWEAGIRWVEKGNWDQRLSNRQCGNICEDLVGGFNEVCEWWEQSIREEFTNFGALEVEAV
ncbi:MAG: hypothetical protein Q9180_000056 [Flavoplaca navasiana]